MPFARWNSFDECKLEQMETGHDEDSAEKICGAIQERAEKGALLKSEEHQLDIITKMDGEELIVGGYASWELKDPQRDVITTKAQVNFLRKFFHEPEHFRNIMWKHGGFQIGTPLLNYTLPNGETVYSHVNEVGTYLISKIRDNSWRSVQTVRKHILTGKLKMYSISGDPIAVHYESDDGEMTRYVDDIDPWEVTLCEKGVNPKAIIKVLSKAEKLCKPCFDKWNAYYLDKGYEVEKARDMAEKLVLKKYEPQVIKSDCDVEVCGGACCRFVTEWSTRTDDDLKKYLRLHGVETKEGEGGMWLRYPVPCKSFDSVTKRCTSHNSRPEICRRYPRRESPFIPLAKCSLLRKKQRIFSNAIIKNKPPHVARGEPDVESKQLANALEEKLANALEEIFTRNWDKFMEE